MVLTRVEDAAAPAKMDRLSASTNEPSRFVRYLGEVVSLILFSASVAGLVITWEDLTCTWVLPSRHRTSLALVRPYDDTDTTARRWGMSTVHGMGFGFTERQLLLAADEEQASESLADDSSSTATARILSNQLLMANIPSYNEVMLRHRTETVPSWKQTPTDATTQEAIHTIIESLRAVEQLQVLVQDYQWDDIRTRLHTAPLVNLPRAASVLRQVPTQGNLGRRDMVHQLEQQQLLRDVVGFDWGSCAWRHCGAIADVQEATDELEQLLNVLEPYEATFCLDIIERSLRDILAVIPWNMAAPKDVEFYRHLSPYESKVSFQITDESDDETDDISRIDAAYFQALRELRVD